MSDKEMSCKEERAYASLLCHPCLHGVVYSHNKIR